MQQFMRHAFVPMKSSSTSVDQVFLIPTTNRVETTTDRCPFRRLTTGAVSRLWTVKIH